jgi:cold shock CspA family protein
MRKTGVVKWWSDSKKFGFISDEDNSEIFYHINDVEHFSPAIGQTVEFEMGKDRNGRIKAVKIRRVGV